MKALKKPLLSINIEENQNPLYPRPNTTKQQKTTPKSILKTPGSRGTKKTKIQFKLHLNDIDSNSTTIGTSARTQQTNCNIEEYGMNGIKITKFQQDMKFKQQNNRVVQLAISKIQKQTQFNTLNNIVLLIFSTLLGAAFPILILQVDYNGKSIMKGGWRLIGNSVLFMPFFLVEFKKEYNNSIFVFFKREKFHAQKILLGSICYAFWISFFIYGLEKTQSALIPLLSNVSCLFIILNKIYSRNQLIKNEKKALIFFGLCIIGIYYFTINLQDTFTNIILLTAIMISSWGVYVTQDIQTNTNDECNIPRFTEFFLINLLSGFFAFIFSFLFDPKTEASENITLFTFRFCLQILCISFLTGFLNWLLFLKVSKYIDQRYLLVATLSEPVLVSLSLYIFQEQALYNGIVYMLILGLWILAKLFIRIN